MQIWGFKIGSAALVLAVLWVLESWIPLFPHFKGQTWARLRHAGGHFFLGLLNTALLSLTLSGATIAVAQMVAEHQWGLTPYINAPLGVKTLVVLLLFDLWMYIWHRLNHLLPFFWRFHRVHHSDPEMDATTALRFHPGEIFLSGVFRLGILVLLGMELWQLALYEAILLPVILFHHSNVAVPERLDRLLRVVLVTPWMHWVHHSDWQPETDSNFSSVLSIWDRLCGTLRLKKDPYAIRYGLKEYRSPDWLNVRGMLVMPFFRTPGKSKR
jgi:sterol desaturase/sphingolipid hydroxylase (fatty acid hydroxylase superfamily)